MRDLFYGMGIGHSIMLLSVVIAAGIWIGRFKIKGVTLGATWILFVGILLSHFGFRIPGELLHFLKEFGLILFVFSIGLQVGPGFFHSFKKGGLTMNMLAVALVLLAVLVTYVIHLVTGEDLATMVGVMSGAVTNTPGLGAAQQAYFDTVGSSAPDIALGYAVAYPLGVIGCIMSFILIRMFYKTSPTTSSKGLSGVVEKYVFEKEADAAKKNYVLRKILISKSKLNGMTLEKLDFPDHLGATVVRINRSGVELAATPHTRLSYGDLVTVVGSEKSVAAVEKVLGNSLKRLDQPNLIPIFVGIALGCILGSIPIAFPGIPQPVKLGLAGGPLIVSILISHFGPRFKVITYTTTSANLMLREIGIALFLACVGLEAGEGFVETIVHGGGLSWIFYGALITLIPVLLGGVLGRFVFKVDYNTLIGVLAGSCTNPPALAFASEQDRSTEAASVGYATVYPLTMFLRVLVAQLLILLFL